MMPIVLFSRLGRRLLAAGFLLAVAGGLSSCGKPASAPGGEPGIKIGFVVKQPEEPWFQLEWKFADQAARELGFTLVKIGAADGEKALAALDNLAAGGAQGVVICAPDTRLGAAIVAKARATELKLIAVDDQFLGANGQPMTSVPYVGISARKIGESVGAVLHAEMIARGWTAADTAVCVMTVDSLATAKERTDGATSALVAAGFPPERIHRTAMRTFDVPGAFDSANVLLTQRSQVRNWLVCGPNDSSVLGAVRALEGRGIGRDRAIGVGINGTDCIVEFERQEPTAFFGSILLSAKSHGYDTAAMMYRWIKDGIAPPSDTRTTGVLITRANFRQVLREHGIRE